MLVYMQAGAAAAGDLLDAATAAAAGGDGAAQAGSDGGSEDGSGATRIGPITRYYMKRVNSNVVHVLFFVVDDEGRAQLAVVVSGRPLTWQRAEGAWSKDVCVIWRVEE